MATCFNCKSQYPDAALFCPSCGSVPESPARESYSGSILLGVALLALILVWQVASLTPTSGENQAPVAPEPPDEAAALINSCGRPDLDRISPDNEVQKSSRFLLYRKAGVKAMFNHGSSSARAWRLKAMVDARTLKPITADKLARRLPCANVGHEL